MSALIEFNVLNRKCGWSRDSSERRRASATSCSAARRRVPARGASLRWAETRPHRGVRTRRVRTRPPAGSPPASCARTAARSPRARRCPSTSAGTGPPGIPSRRRGGRGQHCRGERPAAQHQPFHDCRPGSRRNGRHVRVHERERPPARRSLAPRALPMPMRGTSTVAAPLSTSRSRARPIGVMRPPRAITVSTGSKVPLRRTLIVRGGPAGERHLSEHVLWSVAYSICRLASDTQIAPQ